MLKLIKIKRLLLILFCAITINGYGVTTQFIEDSSIEDFELGTFKGVTIDIYGRLSFSPSTKEIFSQKDILYIWSSVGDNKGTIYFGTGNKPNIYKKSQGLRPKLLYKHTSGLSISSLSLDSQGNIFASVVPDGTIIKIDGKTGIGKVFAKLPEIYIWDIAHDKKDNVYAVTGSDAGLYKISKEGTAKKVFFSKSETNFLCLAVDKRKDHVIFGSGEKGILYKFKNKTKEVEVLYDSYEGEIKDIVLDKRGNIYFSTATKFRKMPPQTLDYRDSFSIYGSISNKNKAGKSGKKIPLKNSIYKLSQGKLKKLLTLDDTLIYSLALDDNGKLYAGTSRGIIYKVEGVNKASIFVKTDEIYVLSLLASGNNLIVTTGNLGKVLDISLSYSKDGVYTSKVFDTGSYSRWGLIKWSGKTTSLISIYTRAGGTKIPDKTWSNWSKGNNRGSWSYIKTPPGQYIQYKIELAKKTKTPPVIQSVVLSYLPANRPPKVDNIMLIKKDDDDDENEQQVKPENINLIPSRQTILKWSAFDEDKDVLTYDVYFKEESYNNWFLLAEGLSENFFNFDIRKLPNGNYKFKVVASDKKSNTPGRIEKGINISKLLKVDNTPPKIQYVKVYTRYDGIYVEGLAKDNLSNIKTIHYSLNSKDWVYIKPKDLLYDQKTELFRFKLKHTNENVVKGNTNILVIRTSDSFDNFSSYETSFRTIK